MALRTFMLTLSITMMLTLTLIFADNSGAEWKVDNNQVLAEEIKQLKAQMADMTARHKRSDDMGSLEVVTSTLTQKVSSLEAEQAATKAQLNTLQNQQGSTYVRWGRSQCPSNANLVYNGVVGSSKTTEQGGGTNRLCLTHSPQFDTAAPLNGWYSLIHGAEWFVPGHDHTTGAQLNDGSFFMYSAASCGSLPCPPYVNGKVVTCVVCSK